MNRRVLQVVALCAALVGVTAPVIAQPKPSASAKPAASATPAPSASAPALPPGHPQIPGPVGDPPQAPGSGALPPGHPATDDQDEQGDGKNPLDDTVVEDPALPTGTIVVTVKDGEDQPLPHASVKLDVLRSTVAKGDSSQQVVREADAGGTVRFEGLSRGSAYSYRLSTSRGPATYILGPFGLGEKGGKRAVLHSFEASATLDSHTMVVMRAAIGISLREDAIEVEQLVSVMNFGRTAWLADMPLELPKGWKAFNKQDSSDDARVEEVPDTGAAIRGTFPPGERDLDFRYQIPLETDATQTIHIRLPQRVTQTRVIAEAARSMGLEVRGFPPAKRVEGRDGKHLLITDFAARAPGEASTIDVTLTGLPTRGPGRWIAVFLAIALLGAGIAYAVQSSGGPLDADAQRDLAEAREALLDELVALERAHKAGEVGPKTYARVRASLLDALARIVQRIEAAAPKPAPAKQAKGPRAQAKPRRRVEGSA